MARSKGYGHIFKRGKYYHIEYTIENKKTSKSLRVTTKEEAEKEAKKLVEAVRKIEDKTDLQHFTAKAKNIIKQNSFTMLKIWDYFYNNYLIKENILQGTKQRYKYRLNLFLSWNSENDNFKMPCELNKVYINKFVNYLYTLDLSQKTLKDTVMNLKSIFNFIKDEAGLINNPFEDITINTKGITVQKKILTEKQIDDLFKTLDKVNIRYKEQYRLLFLIGIHTGARLKDCCLMSKENINIKDKIITYYPSKTKKTSGKAAIIPIMDGLSDVLKEAYHKAETQYLMPEIAALYNKNKKYVIYDINNILKEAGIKNIEEEEQKQTGKRKPCLYGFHSIRYYFITSCSKKNIPLKMIMDAVGHSKELMNLYYQQFNNADRLKAFGIDNSVKTKIIKLLDNAPEETLNKILDILKKT